VKSFGHDSEKYRTVYEPSLAYVYVPHGTSAYTVDEDAKSIGIPNNEVRFLSKCIEFLRQPAEAERARRLLERYTGLSFASSKAWQQWFESNRDKLYFSDYYDYRFYAGPAGPAPGLAAVQTALGNMKLDEPNEVAPATLASAAVGYIRERDGTYSSNKGALVTLIVRLKIADGWHTYARVPDSEANDVTKINVDLPAGARWYGEWEIPKTYEGNAPGSEEYRGDAVFTRQLYWTSVSNQGKDISARRKITLRGTVHCQTCNEERCLPPADIPFETHIIASDR
jgi:hypothetical protein